MMSGMKALTAMMFNKQLRLADVFSACDSILARSSGRMIVSNWHSDNLTGGGARFSETQGQLKPVSRLDIGIVGEQH